MFDFLCNIFCQNKIKNLNSIITTLTLDNKKLKMDIINKQGEINHLNVKLESLEASTTEQIKKLKDELSQYEQEQGVV